MFGRRSAQPLLDQVLKDYQELANSDPHALRKLISEKETWRFFIEKRCQMHGRRLASAKAFQNSENLRLTIDEYLKQIEKLNPNDVKTIRRSALLKQINKHNWRLEKSWWSKITLNDLLSIDRGWIPFENNEKGYLQAMTLAWQEIFKSHAINVDLVKMLHQLSLTNVAGTNYDSYDEVPGEFRQIPHMTFELDKYCASKDGIQEFLASPHLERSIELRFMENKQIKGSITINAASLKAIKQFLDNIELSKRNSVDHHSLVETINEYCLTDDIEDFIKYLQSTPEIMEALTKIGLADKDEVAYWLYHLVEELNDQIKVCYVTSQDEVNNTQELKALLQAKLKNHIDKHYPIIKQSVATLDKLKAIVDLIYECELDHVFADGNGRTICMLLINALLVDSNLPMALLIDSNRFNLYSKDEMLRELIKGMANTMELVKEGKLFKVDTDDIVRQLTTNPLFDLMLNYFQRVQEIEKNGRMERYSQELK